MNFLSCHSLFYVWCPLALAGVTLTVGPSPSGQFITILRRVFLWEGRNSKYRQNLKCHCQKHQSWTFSSPGFHTVYWSPINEEKKKKKEKASRSQWVLEQDGNLILHVAKLFFEPLLCSIDNTGCCKGPRRKEGGMFCLEILWAHLKRWSASASVFLSSVFSRLGSLRISL